VTGPDRRDLGQVFNEVPEPYDRVRPAYPDELFADLVAITGMDRRSSVLEVGCGTGQATRSLAALGYSVTDTAEFAKMRAVMRASEKHREGGVDPELKDADTDPGPGT
jgi:2-polyprenyl-3-methyl-5-hydroxy-6-metoxy-1,4-benzoquinol methylase